MRVGVNGHTPGRFFLPRERGNLRGTKKAVGGFVSLVQARTNFALAFLVRYRGDGSRWFGSKLCPDVRRGAPS